MPASAISTAQRASRPSLNGGWSSYWRAIAATFAGGRPTPTADFGQNFIDNYGWMELFGTRGHFDSDKIAAGFLILGPDIVYPDHHHVAEELYVPLTGGTEWRKGEGGFTVRPAGEVIHHPSNVSHAMRTGAEPLVALYLWRGGPLAQKSTIVAAGELIIPPDRRPSASRCRTTRHCLRGRRR